MSEFDRAMDILLKWEGGFVDHPYDDGGPTNMGITHEALARWRGVDDVSAEQVRSITRSEAKSIFRSLYWDRVRAEEMHQIVSMVVMDGAVNHGVGKISKFLQRTLGREESGEIADDDINELRSKAGDEEGAVRIATAIADLRRDHYVNHKDAVHFLRGWRNRLTDVMLSALKGTGAVWIFEHGGYDQSHSGYIRPVIEDEDLQVALRALGKYRGKIDGIFGEKSVSAMQALLEDRSSQVAGNWKNWSVARQKIALGQLLCLDSGGSPGAVDGLFGPQTEEAFNTYNSEALYQLIGGWRDKFVQADTIKASVIAKDRYPGEERVDVYFGSKCAEVPLSKLELPYNMRLAWNLNTEISSFAIHEKVRDSAERAFNKIYSHYGEDGVRELGLDLFGGCYNCRQKRGSAEWSMHSWGIAIDFDPNRNRLKWNHKQARLARADAIAFWEFWEQEGWFSLGRERDFDWMHVQAARP